MHISEGVLAAPILAAGWVGAAGFLAVGLKATKTEALPRCALVSAVLFLAALVHVPVGPSSVHLALLGLAGILLGWSAVPALFIALLLQALLFQFGGIAVLGLNTASMGAGALAGYYIDRAFAKAPNRVLRSAGIFIAACVAILISTALVTLALAASSLELRGTAALLFAANLPLAAVEGAITLFVALFLKKTFPKALANVY